MQANICNKYKTYKISLDNSIKEFYYFRKSCYYCSLVITDKTERC